SILTAFALFAMPNAPTLFWASVMLWLLTASVNIAMEPFRALVADTLPEEQRTTGFAVQVFFIGTGAVLASAMPWVLTNWLGLSGEGGPGELRQSVRMAFYLGGAGLLGAVLWTVATTRERPPAALDRGSAPVAHPVPSAEGTTILIRSGLLW